MRETAYNMLVCPQLEYAAPVWDPYTKEKTLQLEKIQRRAARWMTSNYDYRSSVTSMLNQLSWRTLEQRRWMPAFVSSTRWSMELWQYPSPTHRVSRYCHSMTFRQIHTNRNYYKYSFFPLAIVQWNALPESVVSLQDLEAFKVAVSKTLDPDTVAFNLILISSSLFLTYHLLFPLTIMLLLYPPQTLFVVIPPANFVCRGYTVFTLSVRASVRP